MQLGQQCGFQSGHCLKVLQNVFAFKGTDVTMEEFRSNKSHEWSDSDDEDLEENEPKEENNAMEQKTKRTRPTAKG